MTLKLLLWASLPGILVLLYIVKRDLFPEPKGAIISATVLGFLIFLPHNLLFILIGDYYFELVNVNKNLGNEVFLNLLESLFQAAFVEETFKYLIFLLLISRFNAFNEPMDAIVYGVCVSLGFSLMETIEWSKIYFDEYGENRAVAMAKIRSYSSNILHAGCGVIMGSILSKAFFQNKNSFLKLFLALLVPILIHGFYNYGIGSGQVFLTYLLLFVCAVLVLVGWRQTRENQKLKNIEKEEKVISINIFNISGVIILNFLIVLILIKLLS